MPEGVDDPLQTVAFLIGDIATNAYACLDMVVTQLVEHYGASIKFPSFPIHNVSALQQIEKSEIPEIWKAAIRALLPEPGEAQLRDNVEAVWIRELSNANKHRNLTPALLSRAKYHLGPEIVTFTVTSVEEHDEDSSKPVRPEVFIWDVQRFGGTRRDGIQVISARQFAFLAPLYVKHALTVFKYAETNGTAGSEPSASPGAAIAYSQATHPSRINHWVWDD